MKILGNSTHRFSPDLISPERQILYPTHKHHTELIADVIARDEIFCFIEKATHESSSEPIHTTSQRSRE